MNLLIVDDERHIVNYLVSLVESKLDADLSIQKAFSAAGALDILSAHKIDIILLDIHMPGCTGLELADKINGSWPRCHIIFLTAYDHFDYVYQANRYSNTSYLLKTESDDAILQEIQRHLDLIYKDVQTEKIRDDALSKDRYLTHLLQQNLLKELLSGYHLDQLQNELHLVGSGFKLDITQPVWVAYMVVRLRSMDEYMANISMLALEYICPAQDLLLESFHSAMLDLGHGNMLWFFQPAEQFVQAVQSELIFLKGFFEDLMNHSMAALHRNLNAVIYSEAVPFSNVNKCYYQLQQQLESISDKATLQSAITVLNRKSDQFPATSGDVQASSEIDRQLQSLSFWLYQNSSFEYDKTLDELRLRCCTLKSTHSLPAIRIYLGVSAMLITYIELNQLQERLAPRIEIYPLYHLTDFSTWEDAFAYLQRFSRQLFDLLSTNTIDKNEAVIRRIKHYIQEHLAEPLPLSTLASVVNYNETYVSRLFRQITGIRLSEYIYQERIAKAKFLLATSEDSIQNVATATGFESQQYFSLVFKKTVGVSPSEYHRQHLRS